MKYQKNYVYVCSYFIVDSNDVMIKHTLAKSAISSGVGTAGPLMHSYAGVHIVVEPAYMLITFSDI